MPPVSPNGGEGKRIGAYLVLSRLLFLRSYAAKILLVAFFGTHIPLIATLVYLFLISGLDPTHALTVSAVALVATLVGTAALLAALYALLTPVTAASRALHAYRERKELPALPTDIEDEGGELLRDTQQTITHLDELVLSLEELSSKDPLTGA